jgi:hypothetical protein
MGNNGSAKANRHIVTYLYNFRMKLININILADPDILTDPDTTQPVKARANLGATGAQIG